MTTAEEFAIHLGTLVDGTVTTSKLPAKPESADDQWSVVADGGEEETGGNFLTWKQTINLRVSYRHKRTQTVYNAGEDLTEAVATFSPTESPAVLSVTALPMADTDEDAEGRHTASWQVKFTTITK